MKYAYDDMPDVICDDHDITELSEPLEKYKLFRELTLFNMIGYDFETGYVWNNLTDMRLGNVNQHGYLTFNWKFNGRFYRVLCHVFLWMMKFWVPKTLMLNHKDGNKQNNSFHNLELVTCSENVLHAYRTGLIDIEKLRKCGPCASEYYNTHISKQCKLDVKEAQTIKYLRNEWNFPTFILNKFCDVDISVIRKLCKGITYRALDTMEPVTKEEVLEYLKSKNYDGPMYYNEDK